MYGNAIIEAAGKPYLSILQAALSQAAHESQDAQANPGVDARGQGPNAFYDRISDGYYTSALIEAIKGHLSDSVELLLAKGADPNGMPLKCMEIYSTAFIRRPRLQRERHPYYTYPKPRSVLIQEADMPQSGNPTQEELEERREMFAPSCFWGHNGYSRSRQNAAKTALEVAAEVGDMESLERVMHYHPDISFWTAPNQQAVRNSPRHSSLSTANPLTIAIQGSHTQVIQRLLQADFNPNIYQSSTPTVAVTPLMATAMLNSHDAGLCYFELLVKESKHPIDLIVRTPIFGINIVHMAAASLSLPMLKAIATHFPSSLTALTCKTALQHSPLHIACLALDDSHINWQSLAIATSIKDVRTLDLDWCPQHPPASYSKVDLEDKVELDVEPNSSLALPQPTDYFKAQYDVIKFLLDACPGQAAADSRDLYGNTPLHYLASYRTINMNALELLLESEASQEAWMQAQNEWGYTPHDLFEKGIAALDPGR